MYKYWLGWLMVLGCSGLLRAQTLSAPVLVAHAAPAPTPVFCEGAAFYVRFQANGLPADSRVVIQLSNASGAFGAGSISQIELGQVRVSGTQEVTALAIIPMSDSLPSNLLLAPGTQYRIRLHVAALNLWSAPNPFPFAIDFLPPGLHDPQRFGESQWIGHSYTFTDPLENGQISTAPFTQAQLEAAALFRPRQYRGYIVLNALNFEQDFAATGLPGTGHPRSYVDSARLCHQYQSHFAIRLKRRQTFAPGQYQLSAGAENGVRVSVDGGRTFVLDRWQESPGYLSHCVTVSLSGTVELVIEYFQRNSSRARLGFAVTPVPAGGDPIFGITPPSIANGGWLCTSDPPFQLNATVSGGWYSSSPAGFVSKEGLFRPDALGLLGGQTQVTVTYTVGYAGCARSSQLVFFLNDSPNAGFSGLNPARSYCSHDAPVTLVPDEPGGVFSGPGVTGNVFDPSRVLTQTQQEEVVVIRYRLERSNTCQAMSTQSVRVRRFLQLQVDTTGFRNLCFVPNANYFLPPPVPASTVVTGPGMTGPLLFSPTVAGFQHAPGNIQTYTFTYVYDQGTPCRQERQVSVQMIAPLTSPRVTNSTVSEPVCVGGTITLEVTNAAIFPPGTLFEWQGPGGWRGEGAVVHRTNVSLADAGRYYCRSRRMCNSLPDSTLVRIREAAQSVSISGVPSTVCQFEAPLPLSGSPAGGRFEGPGVRQNLFDPQVAGPGEHTLRYVLAVQGCSREAVLRVRVQAAPTAPIAPAEVQACEGLAMWLSISAPEPGLRYIWTGPNNFVAEGREVRRAVALPGLYQVQALRADGCKSLPALVQVNTGPIAAAAPVLTGDRQPCVGTALALHATGIMAGDLGVWMRDTVQVGAGAYWNKAHMSLADTGHYAFRLRRGVCEWEVPFGLRARPAPPAETIRVLGTVCDGQRALLRLDRPYPQIRWHDGSTTDQWEATQFGQYSVRYTATNGCQGQASIELREDQCQYGLHIPDAFTPNGDGTNDHWRIQGLGVVAFELTIYNRWGEAIYHTRDLGQAWDGTWQQQPCPAGEYTYVARYEVVEAGRGTTIGRQRSGVLFLLR